MYYIIKCEIFSTEEEFLIEADNYSKDRIASIFSEVHPEAKVISVIEYEVKQNDGLDDNTNNKVAV